MTSTADQGQDRSSGRATSGRSRDRRRADARRSISAIIAAASELFTQDPDASMVEIARAAGVGRVTLYAHFPTREDLVRSVLSEAILRGTQEIAAAAPDEGPPAEAFARLVRTCWPVLARAGSLHRAALRALPAEEVRRRHDLPMEHVRRLIARGRAAGDFRTDLPVDWLVTTVYALLHASADEVTTGRMPAEDVGDLLVKTLLAVLRPPH